MFWALHTLVVLCWSWQVGHGNQFSGQIDKVFSVLANQRSGCDVITLPETVDWCNGTLAQDNLLPHLTACQTTDLEDEYLLCRNGLWWNGNTPFHHSVRTRRSGIGAVVTLEKKQTCTWICAEDDSDYMGSMPPEFVYCPNSTVVYPVGNSTTVTPVWQIPVVTDDGNITSFQQIVGPHSSTALEATKTPGTIYHVSYMAEDDNKLKWPCWFTIDAEIPVCPAIVNFKHGTYTCDDDNLRGSTCTFQCEIGYVLNTTNGTNSTTCQDDGSWSFGENMPECVPVSCGNLVANTTDIQFACYEDSRDYGSVCWARCKYGYILRNDKQEEDEEEELSNLVDQAQERLDNAETARAAAEPLQAMAEESELLAQAAANSKLTANQTAADIANQAEAVYITAFGQYNQSLVTALQAEYDAQQAYANNDTNADELAEIASNLTTIAEQQKVQMDSAYADYMSAANDASLANMEATEAVAKLAAAQMYLNETNINLENAMEEEAEALQAQSEALENFNVAKLYNGQDDKVVNTFARCESDGSWYIPGDPFCIDTEPPSLKCIPIYEIYLEPSKSEIKATWPLPELQDDVQDAADIIQILGPANGTYLAPGQYEVVFIARDISGNTSPQCSMIVNIEARSCAPVSEAITDENLLADCDSYLAGSTCPLTCKQKYSLDGHGWVTCEDDKKIPEIYFKWNFVNTTCYEDYCADPPDPIKGKFVCENTTDGGSSCNIICDDNFILPYNFSPAYHCDANGAWNSTELPTRCIESGELQVAVHTLNISYYSSNYSDTCIQLELEDEQVAIETALRSHLQTFQSCEENFECMLKPTTMNCNDDEEDGLRTLTVDIITTCPDNPDIPCNLSTIIMEKFESDLTYSIEDVGILDHLNVTLATDWLSPVSDDIPVCPTGSVLHRAYCAQCDVGYYMDNSTNKCLPCPVGTYNDIPGQSSCTACSTLTSTTGVGKTSPGDCKALCGPGSYSETTMIPCITCDTGTYQPEYGSTQCHQCPDGTWTTIAGAENASKCILFDIYFEKDFPEQDIGITDIVTDMSAIFWIKGYDIPILTFGLFYDDTDFAFKIVTEENIQIFTDGWDNTPTDVMMTKNEWIMLVVVWNVLDREMKLYKNGELAFIMNTNDRLEYPDKVVLSVKEDTFLGGFVMFPYVLFPQLILTAYSECGTTPGIQILSVLAALRPIGLKPVPSTCQASEIILQDSCENHGCLNNGACVPNDTIGYTCNCTEEYGGFFCEVELVHGNWGDWINATDCSVTCGSGVRAVYRHCDNPAPGLYGKDCEGNSTDFVECQQDPCRECEDPPETATYGTVCELRNDECTPSCPEGMVLPKGQREQKYRCGVSTNYEWVPLKNLPICARVRKPEGYTIVSTYEVSPAVPCDFIYNITAGFQDNVQLLPCPLELPNCNTKVEFKSCLDVSTPTTTTTMEVRFEVPFTVEGEFDLEEYFATRNITDTIDEVVTVIYVMELTINQILARPEDLDVLFLNVTYTIVPGSEYIVALTTCPVSLVDTQGVCVECQTGTRQQDNWCVYCEKGYYQHGTGQSACIPCPEGMTTEFLGARSEAECIDIITEPPTTTPAPTDIGPIIIIVVCVIAGIVAVLAIVCTVLKFYITSKRRQQYDMEAETTSLYTEFPDITYNMYFKNKQVLGFDEKGMPIISHGGFENGDVKDPFRDQIDPFGDKGDKLPPMMPPLEPFSFSARPVSDMPFDHPPPNLKKKSFEKPAIDPIKHFDFPNMREIPVRFRVPKRKHFENKYPRHTFGLPDEEDAYISKRVPVPKNATKLLYKSPAGENIYAYLFKDGSVRTMSPEEGIRPDVPLLKAQYLGDDGEFEFAPPVFEKLKLGDEPTSKPKRTTKSSAAGSRSTRDGFDSRPSTGIAGSRPSTTKSKRSPRSPRSGKSRGTPRSGRSARLRGAPQEDSYRSLTSSESPRIKSALLRPGSKSAKSVSIIENEQISRPTTAGTFLSQARSSRPTTAGTSVSQARSTRHSLSRLADIAETYTPRSVNIMEFADEHPGQIMSPGRPLSVPLSLPEDQTSSVATQLKDQKMKLMVPPSSKARTKSITPIPSGEEENTETLESFRGLDTSKKGVHFDNADEVMDKDIENDHPDSDSSGSVVFTKSKKLKEKRPSRVSQTSTSRVSRGSTNGVISRTPRASISNGVAPKPVIPEGMTTFKPPKDFIENLNLPVVPPRGHQLKGLVKPTALATDADKNDNVRS